MPLPERNVHGVKRKKTSDHEESRGDNLNLEVKLRRKLHHAVRELCKVVKKARTFEVQKTLKKLKDARRKDPESDMTRHLAAQMEVLKHLKYNELAHSALMTKLNKDNTLCTDPTIRALSVQLASNLATPGAPGTPTAKIQGRILSSKVLASEVSSIVESLRRFLQEPKDIGGATDNSHTLPNTPKRRRTGIDPENSNAFTPKDGAAEPSGGWSSGEYENGDEAAAEVDDGWESDTVNALSGSDDFVVGAVDDHESTSRDASASDLPSEDARRKQYQPHGSWNQSEFLPSLSVGFARDSGGELSDSELKWADGIKRNRRGQRARRAIWEKKFGKDANHIKRRRQQQDTEYRQPGSAPVDRRSGKGNTASQRRRTPMESGSGHGKVRRLSMKSSEGVKRSGSEAHSSKSDPRGRQGGQALHPSWEAKRKKVSASIVPSQGTKIVF